MPFFLCYCYINIYHSFYQPIHTETYIYIYIYIYCHTEIVSLYPSTIVWVDTSSWDRNPAEFSSVGYLTHEVSSYQSQRNRRDVWSICSYVCYQLPKCLIHEKSFVFTRMWNPVITRSSAQLTRGSVTWNKKMFNHILMTVSWILASCVSPKKSISTIGTIINTG